nr:TPA_asm: ATP6 [Bombus bohemicus]
MIMMNLFEAFDPAASSCNTQINWIYMFITIILFPEMYWMISSRTSKTIKLFVLISFIEFKIILLNDNIMNINLFMTTMVYILTLNLSSLIPYIFTLTSHLIFNLMMSFPPWLSFILFSMINFPMKTFSHLVPLNSPKFLMNFMVIIELISLLIRPWTLAIRLSANLISGHLILILLSNFMVNFLLLSPFVLMIQNLLMLLELSMSIIQAYVFSTLLILYFSETK